MNQTARDPGGSPEKELTAGTQLLRNQMTSGKSEVTESRAGGLLCLNFRPWVTVSIWENR